MTSTETQLGQNSQHVAESMDIRARKEVMKNMYSPQKRAVEVGYNSKSLTDFQGRFYYSGNWLDGTRFDVLLWLFPVRWPYRLVESGFQSISWYFGRRLFQRLRTLGSRHLVYC